MSDKIKSYIIFVLRIILGGVFVFSGYMKAIDINEFIKVIYKIKFIPYDLSNILAICIVGLELILGIFLILGLYIDISVKISFFILIIFTLFIGVVLIFSLEIESCQCFGNLSEKNITYIDIIRNSILIILATLNLLFNKSSKTFSIDQNSLKHEYPEAIKRGS